MNETLRELHGTRWEELTRYDKSVRRAALTLTLGAPLGLLAALWLGFAGVLFAATSAALALAVGTWRIVLEEKKMAHQRRILRRIEEEVRNIHHLDQISILNIAPEPGTHRLPALRGTQALTLELTWKDWDSPLQITEHKPAPRNSATA